MYYTALATIPETKPWAETVAAEARTPTAAVFIMEGISESSSKREAVFKERFDSLKS